MRNLRIALNHNAAMASKVPATVANEAMATVLRIGPIRTAEVVEVEAMGATAPQPLIRKAEL